MRSFFFRGSLFFFVIAAGCGPMTVPVQSDSKPQRNRLPSALLSFQTAIAVGEAGTILRTMDGGATWTMQDSGTSASLGGVAFADPNVGAVVGQTILQTTDGGATWRRHYNWITANGVSFVDANAGWAVDGGGGILHTTDGGVFWTRQFTAPVSLRAVSFVDRNTGWAAGVKFLPHQSGYILKTTDGGATWTSQLMGSPSECHFPQPCRYARIYGVSFVDANTGWVVGEWENCPGSGCTIGNLLSRTDDGGVTWTGQATPSGYGFGLRALAYVDANTAWAVGGDGAILHTTDGGATTWTLQSFETTTLLNSVSFVDANTGWAVGWAGTILGTTDGGSTWSPQSSGTGVNLNGVAFVGVSAQ